MPTLIEQIPPSSTFVQLLGVSRPNPTKAGEFRSIGRAAALGAIETASRAGVAHFIYLGVAQPAPVMKSYFAVRAECEAALVSGGLKSTILRPWYVLGPGHRWPYLFRPFTGCLRKIPGRAMAQGGWD